MFTKSLSLLIGFCFAFFAVTAQQDGAHRIIPPSPTAASLGNYGDIQLGYYTGTAEIAIPIFTLAQGDIKLPISLSASARALPVGEVPGWVGAGMNLFAGGVITRSTASLPDDVNAVSSEGYVHNLTLVGQIVTGVANGTVSNTNMDKVINNMVDLQPDIYSYNFNGYSGRFYIDLNGDVHSFSHDNVLFDFTLVQQGLTDHSQDKFMKKWTATTPDGMVYEFEALEWTSSEAFIATSSRYFWHVSSWYLTSITSPQGHVVTFTYTTPNTSKPRMGEYYFDKIGKWECYGPNDPSFGATVNAPSTSLTEVIHLSKIECANATILFQTSVRNDLYQQYTYGTPCNSNPAVCQEDRKLDRIIIKNADGNVINQFDFAYHEVSTDRLQLTSVQEAGKTPYSFEYNGVIPVTYSSKSIDHWGYYNGASNTNLIPVTTVNIPSMGINNVSYGLANRAASLTNGKLGSLKKVIFPTGGSTEFDYEQNDYAYVNSNAVGGGNRTGGGIRIKKITNSDAVTSQTVVKDLEYFETGTTSSGVAGSEPEYQIYIYNIPNYACTDVFWLQSSSVFPLSYTSGNSVGYRKVKEKFSDGSENLYTYKTFAEYPDGAAAFSYPINASNNGVVLQLAPKTSNDHKRGKLANVTMKDKFGNTVKEVTTSYIVKTQNAYTDRYLAFTPVNDPLNGSTPGIHPVLFPILVAYDLKSEWVVKEKDTEKMYDQVNSVQVTTETTYSYDNATHIQLTKTSQVNSKGETVETVYRYPSDAIVSPSPTTAEQLAINELIDKRAFTTLLEQEQFVSTVSVDRKRHTYKQFTTGAFPLLYKVSEETNGAGLVDAMNLNEYDAAGNITEQVLKDKLVKKYIWDYNSSLPILEITGVASNAKFAFTSFESDNSGGWSWTANKIASVHGGITGRKAYNIGTQLTTTGLDQNVAYTVSFWVDADKPEITQTNPNSSTTNIDNSFQLKATVGSWKLYKATVTGATAIKIVSHTGDALTYIDEVRLFPASALISTYTYDPLVGMTGQCDVNDRIIYYTYDPHGRLMMIRDQDKNILKRYCYNYNTQSDNCNFYGNAAISQAFQKQCAYGYTGTSVNYTVPANTYYAYTQAEADAMAQAEADAKGLAFANLNGTCNPVTIYAVLSVENVSYSSPNYYGDVVVRFYSDENLTIPYSVQNLNVNFREYAHGGLCGCLAGTTNYTVNCNGDTFVLMEGALIYETIYGSGEVDYMERWYVLRVGTGYVGGE